MQTATHIIEEDRFKYMDSGEGEVLVLLHGLFGGLSNFGPLIQHFETKLNVVVPILRLRLP